MKTGIKEEVNQLKIKHSKFKKTVHRLHGLTQKNKEKGKRIKEKK